MAPNGTEPRAWTISNTIMAAMGALILLMLSAGFWSIISKIETGDMVINARITELAMQMRFNNDRFQKITEDVARIDTFQKIRLEKEYGNEMKERRVK